MPTYGFIRETAEDRFYERGGGAGPRLPRTVPCPVCGESLSDETALAIHLGSVHPLSSPRLLLGGDVVVGERILHRRMSPDDLSVVNATELLVAENGGSSRPWSTQALRQAVAEAEHAVLDITLRNERAGDGASAIEQVRLRLDVPDPPALDAIDRFFQEHLAAETLDELRLDGFASAAADFRRGERYASALHEYCVALLVKDQARGTGQALPFAAHREKLQRALNTLRHFPERGVARAVCGFARFSLNDFASASATGVVELDRCTEALRRFAGFPEQTETTTSSAAEVGRCPTDQLTSLILERWDDHAAVPALLDAASRPSTTSEDRAKLEALALRQLPPSSETERLARSLVNDPVFGRAVAAMIEDVDHDG